MRPAVVFWCVGAGIVLCGAVAVGDALACGGAMLNHPSRLIAKRMELKDAATFVDAGDLTHAARALNRASPYPSQSVTRGQRLAAKLIARSGGAYGPDFDEGGLPRENLEWAVAAIESVARMTPKDPRALTDLGEVLSYHPRYQKRAKQILEDLAKRDLITSAHGYKALSDLRQGDAQALERCRLMTRDPDRVCGKASKPTS